MVPPFAYSGRAAGEKVLTAACPEEFLNLAEAMADAARRVTLKYFRQPVDTIRKADDTPVTAADRETEAVITATVDLAEARQARQAWGVFRDRRPDLYDSLRRLDASTA